MREGIGRGFIWICVDLGFGPSNKKGSEDSGRGKIFGFLESVHSSSESGNYLRQDVLIIGSIW